MITKCPYCGASMKNHAIGGLHCLRRQLADLESYITELEDTLTREQIQGRLKKAGIDMKPSLAKLQKLLDSRKSG
ncbi:MAG: hypothetical protein KAV00_06955 [Phycisphaerae bacterium]|nr:hypothetical protein [Phycisphaerae bacterium]